MVKKFLITRPNHDVITSYLFSFSKELVDTLKQTPDIHISDLPSNLATRERFEYTVKKEKPTLVFLNGHGDKKRVAGYKDDIVLDEKNISLLKNTIVYALACDSLVELGERAIAEGVFSYVGYQASFMLVHNPSREATPEKDSNALPFRRACTTLINALVYGHSVSQAVEKTKEEYRKLIRSHGTSEDDPYGDTPLIRFALAWNLEFLDFRGSSSVSF